MRDYFKSQIVLRGKEDTSATVEKKLAEGIIYLLAKIKLNKFNGLVEFSYKERRERRCSKVNLRAFGVPFELWSVSIAEVFTQYICAKTV